MPIPPPFGEDLPEGTVLTDPNSLAVAIRMAPEVSSLWFVLSPSTGGMYTNGWECREWVALRTIEA